MEKSDQDNKAQRENLDEADEERKSDRVSEYHFFVARDIQGGGRELTGKDAESGEKKEIEEDRSVTFFLSE
jgi:hypothetical protein